MARKMIPGIVVVGSMFIGTGLTRLWGGFTGGGLQAASTGIVSANLLLSIDVIIGLIFIVTGIGLYKLSNWAKNMAICISICMTLFISITFSVVVYRGLSFLTLSIVALILFILSILPMIYFTRPKVKEQFK